MQHRDLVRFLSELGWNDPVEVVGAPATADAGAPSVVGSTPAACESLDELASLVDGCTRCGLSQGRRTIVFGEGDPHARLMFIGEGPGAEEDRTGRPFVGQAGQLLDAMIAALGLVRGDVFIANVVKCRPPGNRDPQEEEMAACAAYLDRQVQLIQPGVIVALGRISARRLTGTEKPMRALRGRWSSYRGVPLLPTYHPAYLLRNPIDKRLAWADLKMVRARLAEG